MATPASPLPEVARQLASVTAVLAQANVAIPVIVGTVTAVVSIIKALKGTAPPMADLIRDIEQQVAANQARGEAELARLRALLTP